MPASDRKIVESLAGNSVCMECGAPGPEWASVTLAIVLCLDCSGRHRGLGTHLSFVRSITMDSWSEKQLQSMKAGGGNEACRKFLSHHGVLVHPTTTGRLNDTYDTPAAELYRQVIKARVEGRPEPTELPQATKPRAATDWEKRPLQGFGNGPHPAHERQRQRRTIAIGIAGSAVAVAVGIFLKR